MRCKNWDTMLGVAINSGAAREEAWQTPYEWVWDTLNMMGFECEEPEGETGHGQAENLAAAHGLESIAVAFASRGDLVTVGKACGIMGLCGRLAWVPRATKAGQWGLMPIPRDKCDKAWRVA